MKFKVFVSAALIIIIIFQAVIVGILVYGGIKIQHATKSAQQTINDKTSSLTNINDNLTQANQNLTKISQDLQNSPYAKP